MTEYLLFNKSDKCCGCRACEHVCPKGAISMREDEEGFLYPVLDNALCVKCGLCAKSCPMQNDTKTDVSEKAYAVQYKNKETLRESSSGGVFSALADFIVDDGGFIGGCVFDDDFNVIHILTNDRAEVAKMRGSKYVQSDTKNTYKEAEEKLKDGKTVLYSGTPCQIDGLKSYLGEEYSNLITVDLICHGVPSPMLFLEYLKASEKKNGKLIDIKFRNKKLNGWSAQGSAIHIKNTRVKRSKTSYYNDSYYQYYMNDNISRMCCYSCKYASVKRVSDITIGDYWNISDILPEFDFKDGVSVVLANTKAGTKLLDKIKDNIIIKETKLSEAVKGNGNLSAPSKMPESRKDIYKRIKEYGYEAVAKQDIKYQYLVPFIKKHTPRALKRLAKRIINKQR